MTSGRERYRRARPRSIEVECIAEVDIEEFETEVLVDELRRRSIAMATDDREEILAAHEAIRDGRTDEARWILERLLWPKWKNPLECESALKTARLQ